MMSESSNDGTAALQEARMLVQEAAACKMEADQKFKEATKKLQKLEEAKMPSGSDEMDMERSPDTTSATNGVSIRMATAEKADAPLVKTFSLDVKRLAVWSSNVFLVGDSNGVISRINVETGTTTKIGTGYDGYFQNPITALAVVNDSRFLTGCCKTIKLWNKDGKVEKVFLGHIGIVESLAVLPGTTQFVSASGDGTVRLWDLNGEKSLCIWKITGSVCVTGVAALDSHLFVAGCTKRTSLLHDTRKNTYPIKEFTGHANKVYCVASSDGNHFLSGALDNTIKLWNVESGECVRTFVGHSEGIMSLAVLGKKNRFVSASMDNTVKLWNVETGDCLATFTEHTMQVVSVSAFPDGQHFVSGSSDQSARLWNVGSGILAV